MSPSLTGPFTLRMIWRFWSSRNLTRTCVTCYRRSNRGGKVSDRAGDQGGGFPLPFERRAFDFEAVFFSRAKPRFRRARVLRGEARDIRETTRVS